MGAALLLVLAPRLVLHPRNGREEHLASAWIARKRPGANVRRRGVAAPRLHAVCRRRHLTSDDGPGDGERGRSHELVPPGGLGRVEPVERDAPVTQATSDVLKICNRA